MIKKQIPFLLLFVCILLTGGCDDKTFRTETIRIRFMLPDKPGMGFETTPDPKEYPIDSIVVRFMNESIGNSYTALTDSNGIVEIAGTAGAWSVAGSKTITKGFTDYFLSGGYSPIYINANEEATYLEFPLFLSVSNKLLIEELYFNGCLLADGKSSYVKDQYITLANNSDETLYLDGLCIAQLAPSTTAKASGWILNTDMSELPLFLMCWQFPGKGADYPILPDTQQVIATHAIDHTAGEAGVKASIDLSHAEWAFWDKSLTGSNISAGVRPLSLIWRSGGTSYALTTSGPTVVLFRPESDLAAYVSNPSHIRMEPGSASSAKYLHIPADWVVDIANFVSSNGTISNSRVPKSLDVFPGISGPNGSGKSMRRRNISQDGKIRWKDTNETNADFRSETPSMKNKGTKTNRHE